MDNRKLVFIIVVLLLLLLCFYNCKKDEVRTLTSQKIAFQTQPSTTQRPAYLGRPVIDPFVLNDPIITEAPTLEAATIVYTQTLPPSLLLTFSKEMAPPGKSLDHYIVYVNGVVTELTGLRSINYTTYTYNLKSLICNNTDTVLLDILSDNNIYSADGFLFEGITNFPVRNE